MDTRSSKEIVRRYWTEAGEREASAALLSPNAASPRYERRTRDLLQQWTLRQIACWSARRPARRALDLGCAYGDMAARLTDLADEVVAVDISEPFVRQTEARLRATGHPRARALCADIAGFDEIDGADLVHLGAVLMHLEDDEVQAVLRRLGAGMRPGGLVIEREFAVMNFGVPRRNESERYFSVRRRKRTYRRWAEDAGLRTLAVSRSMSIYADQLSHDWLRPYPRLAALLSLPLEGLIRLASVPFGACSTTFIYQVP